MSYDDPYYEVGNMYQRDFYESDDHGPADSDGGPDRDEYEPGGSRFDADDDDTPSLQDSDPESYGAAYNVNPWGQEGGY